MAKKKTTHQDQTTQNGEKTHQSDDVSEKIESLKSLNSMLLKETVERRQQVDSLKESNGLLESDLKRVEMEKNEILGKVSEVDLVGEIERDLMFLFVGVQMSEILGGFERERFDFEERLGGFEREIVSVVKEKSEVEEVKREREVEIEGLRREMSGALREIERERVSSRSERDELRREIDGVVEENRGLNVRIGVVEERERGARDEVKELRGKCERLEGEIEEKGMTLDVVLRERGLIEKSVLELNKMGEGLRGKVDEMIRENAGLVVERDLKAEKISKLENAVSRLNDVMVSFRKEEEKLRVYVGGLERKCGEEEAKEKELRMEIGELGKSLDSLLGEKGLIKKELDEALKQSDELKSRVEEILKEKSVVEGAKEKQEGEFCELKMQVTDLKETVHLLEETSRAEKEKMEELESEVGRCRDEVTRITTERNEARKSLKQEASCKKELVEKLAEKEKSIEESSKVTEKIKNQKSSLNEQKKELENCHSLLKKDLAMAEKKLAETQKELESAEGKLGLANANSEKILNLLRNTVTLVSKNKDGNGSAEQVKAGEQFKAHVAEFNTIKDAIESRESAIEDMRRKLESLQHSEAAAHKKSFWAVLTSASATVFAAASLAYATRH
ncbi:uncharacterized protein LOC141664175 [Apium graveolens]|uniref:uncharacterized protein LOC141664175 n=1 Tax=Apium graveolens TaxID=4045 RepID=UPI003D7AA6DC